MAALRDPSVVGATRISPAPILELGMAFFGAKALLSAVELGLFTELAQGPATAAELTDRLGLHPRGARDFFDSLVALNMLERRGQKYCNTPESDLFLDRHKPTYAGGILEMTNARLYRFWGSLTEALRTGEPQNEIHEGQDLLQLHCNDERWLRAFLRAMTGVSMAAGKAIAERFSWRDYRTFADVGAGQGNVPVQIAVANQHLAGIGFDLPPVAPIFNEYISSFGLQDRLRFEAGDFFKEPLPRADVLIMGHILHGLSLEQKRELIGRAYQALEPGGAFIVFEMLIDDARRENALALLMSLNMLIETRQGFDFTGADCQQWMRDAGFRKTYVQHLDGPHSMAVAIK